MPAGHITMGILLFVTNVAFKVSNRSTKVKDHCRPYYGNKTYKT